MVFFLFRRWKTFTAEECPHPSLKRQDSRKAPDRSRDCYLFLSDTPSQCWTTLVPFCWMLYRRNCNPLLSSSLQRCYINGVCFAFQLAALWKRHSAICPWEHQLTFRVWKERRGQWNSVGCSVHRGCSPRDVNVCCFADNVKEKPTNEEKNGRPSHLSTWYHRYPLFLFHVKTTELLPFASARKPICCHQSMKPNQSTAIWLTAQLMN